MHQIDKGFIIERIDQIDIVHIGENLANRLLYIGIEMHRIEDIRFGMLHRHLFECFTNIQKTLSEIFTTMPCNQDQLLRFVEGIPLLFDYLL
ncbi:hypothetical protein D1872_280370 [compost metagenome]